jgi:tetratricopeptide (TPR) repeat protein
MKEPVTIDIPLDEFDLSLLPKGVERSDTPEFREAVTEFFRSELREAAEWVQVAFDGNLIRLTWTPRAGGREPFEQAVGHLKSGDYNRGIQLLNVLLRMDPKNPHILYNLGMALSDLGRLEEAIKHLRNAARATPENANIHVALGVAHYRAQKLLDAKKYLEKALSLDSENPYALRNLGACMLAMGVDPSKAETHLKKAVSILPEDQQSWVSLGRALEDQEKLDEADRAYVRALEINPYDRAAEMAKAGRTRISEKVIRQAAGGGIRMDAVMYCLGALERFQGMSKEEIQKIAFEIAALGTKGINPGDMDKKYRLRTLPGEFSGLQLLSYMYVTWKKTAPEMDMGFDLSKEYQQALMMFQAKQKR